MLKKIFLCKNLNSYAKLGVNKNMFISNYSFIKYTKRYNFDQYRERSKRHFVLIYRYIDDMHYKRSKKKCFNKKSHIGKIIYRMLKNSKRMEL